MFSLSLWSKLLWCGEARQLLVNRTSTLQGRETCLIDGHIRVQHLLHPFHATPHRHAKARAIERTGRKHDFASMRAS